MMTTDRGGDARGIVAVRADANGDPKQILASLQAGFADFKAAHTKQLDELKKGQDDVVRREQVDKISAEVTKLQAALDQSVMDVAALRLGGGSGGERPRDREYEKTFATFMKQGEDGIRASLKKAPDSDGGFLAPVEWDRTIVDKLVKVSPMRQIASVQTISAAGFKKAFNARGTGSGWVGETAARPETTTPTLGQLDFAPGELYANPAASQGLLDDAEVDIEQWLASEVETEFAYQEGLAFISGNGTNKPFGFLAYVTGGSAAARHPWGALPQKVAASATAITSDELIDVIYDLPNEFSDNARWVMNRSTTAKVRKLKDGQGNYLWQPSAQVGQPATLFNYPITEMAGMPDAAANAFPIAFGDFRRGYLIIDRIGVRVLRDPYTNKPFVHFYTTKRVGGGVQNPETLRVLKMAAA